MSSLDPPPPAPPSVDRTRINLLLNAEDPVEGIERGVSYEFLARLLKKQKLGALSTRQVVKQYIFPQTFNSRCSLSGLLRVLHPASVGRATHYVVHAWDGNFERLVQALGAVDASHDDEEGNPPYFWIDVFALNQRQQSERYRQGMDTLWIQRDELFLELKSVLRQIDKVCVVVDPVDRPLVLSRAWCLFECAQSLSLKRDVMLCAVPEPPDVDPFEPLVVSDFEKRYSFDFRTAETSVELDKEWLSAEALSLSPQGANFVNAGVKEEFLTWLGNRLSKRVLVPDFLLHIKQEEVEKRVRLMHSLSAVLAWREAERARECLERALKGAEKLWGMEEEPTLQINHDYACLIAKQFKELKRADVLLSEVLLRRTELFGVDHESVVSSSEALGLVRKERRKLTDAINLFRAVVAWKESKLGKAHFETLKSLNHLALTLQKKECYSEAEVLFRRVVAGGLETLGPSNLDVMVWSNNLSMLYQDTRQLDKAEILLKNTLRNCESALGAMHAHTLILVYNLGYVLWQQGRVRVAEQLFRRELAACESLKGAEHADTVRSRQNLERLLEQRRQKETEPVEGVSQIASVLEEGSGEQHEPDNYFSSSESEVAAYEDEEEEGEDLDSEDGEDVFEREEGGGSFTDSVD